MSSHKVLCAVQLASKSPCSTTIPCFEAITLIVGLIFVKSSPRHQAPSEIDLELGVQTPIVLLFFMWANSDTETFETIDYRCTLSLPIHKVRGQCHKRLDLESQFHEYSNTQEWHLISLEMHFVLVLGKENLTFFIWTNLIRWRRRWRQWRRWQLMVPGRFCARWKPRHLLILLLRHLLRRRWIFSEECIQQLCGHASPGKSKLPATSQWDDGSCNETILVVKVTDFMQWQSSMSMQKTNMELLFEPWMAMDKDKFVSRPMQGNWSTSYHSRRGGFHSSFVVLGNDKTFHAVLAHKQINVRLLGLIWWILACTKEG